MPLERFQAATGGHSELISPQTLPKDHAPHLENLLVHLPGALVMRPPFIDPVMLWADSTKLMGYWRFGDEFLIEATRISDGTVIAAHFDVSTGLATAVTTTRCIVGRSVTVGNLAYGIPHDNNVLLKWAGTAASPPLTVAFSPQRATCLAAHLGRLFVGGGSVPGTTSPVFGNRIYWTDPEGAPLSTLAEWQDNTSGLVNQISVGSFADPITALASLGRQLVIFKGSSIWVLTGDTPDSFTLRQISDSIGLRDAASRINVPTPGAFTVTNDTVYWLDQYGKLRSFDGESIQTLGGHQKLYDDITLTTLYDMQALANDYLVMSTTYSTWLFHLPSEAWIKLSGGTGVFNGERPFWFPVTEDGTSHYVSDGRAIWPAKHLTRPEALLPHPPFGQTKSYDRTPAGADVRVPARWVTRTARLALPDASARIRRVMVDHNADSSNGVATETWQVTGYNAAGQVVVPPFTIGEVLNLGIQRPYYRDVIDAFGETGDIFFEVVYTGTTANAYVHRSLFDIWVEYEPAQRQKPL